jgi:hypothetical protein
MHAGLPPKAKIAHSLKMYPLGQSVYTNLTILNIKHQMDRGRMPSANHKLVATDILLAERTLHSKFQAKV